MSGRFKSADRCGLLSLSFGSTPSCLQRIWSVSRESWRTLTSASSSCVRFISSRSRPLCLPTSSPWPVSGLASMRSGCARRLFATFATVRDARGSGRGFRSREGRCSTRRSATGRGWLSLFRDPEMDTVPPLKELEAEIAGMQRAKPNQLFVSLLQLKGGWRANHALEPTRTSAPGSPRVPRFTCVSGPRGSAWDR
jgi:hypothetical protein